MHELLLSFFWKPLIEVCSQPLITLIPDGTSLTAPIQFQRYQDVYISSNIVLNCRASLSIRAQWTINNCTSNCSALVQLNPSVATTYTELFLPARTLNYGIYQLQLTVVMTASSTAIASAIAYIKITPSGITANLVQFGTSIISSGHEKNLLLDPGTYSVDPDHDTFDANVSEKFYTSPVMIFSFSF